MTSAAKSPAESNYENQMGDGIFGFRPVLHREELADYEALLTHVADHVKPRDILEKIWLKDAVDLTWENIRWRRLAMKFIEDHEIRDWVDYVERLDRLATMAEARRNSALREIERHRSLFAANLRREISEAEEVEFELLENKSTAR